MNIGLPLSSMRKGLRQRDNSTIKALTSVSDGAKTVSRFRNGWQIVCGSFSLRLKEPFFKIRRYYEGSV